ncbi:MAG TPA: hypothetical protein VGB85_17240 [Nannocystis sp.]|jgi:hypothetical protein
MSGDTALKLGMLTAILLVATLGAMLGYAVTWLLAKVLPRPAVIPLGIVLCLAGAAIAVHVVFPDILRSIRDDASAPTYHFQVPSGFTGRFTLVHDPAGVRLVEDGRRVEIPVPPDRMLRVQPSPALEHTDPRLTATRDGAPTTIIADESGQWGGIRYQTFYVGTYDDRARDPGSSPPEPILSLKRDADR